jgi:uncharacterized protein (TIGR00661 family)
MNINMKILYALQATGNGHISRAMELLPYLQQQGTVDLFLSGSNSTLELDAPVKYRSKGMSLFYNCNGGLDYFEIIRKIAPLRLRKEINELPVHQYDLIINDFDYITAAACAKRKIPSVNFGHQASFLSSHTPRPEKRSAAGEWILRNYAKASHYIGLHFCNYDNFIFTPVVKQEILEANPVNGNYIAVYLPSLCEPQLIKIFSAFSGHRFEIFCQHITPREEGNIRFLPVNKQLFNQSLINCTGLITGGGFETPAEALHLGKKIMCIPIRGQYEQQCNAAAIQKLGATVLAGIDDNFSQAFYKWIQAPAPGPFDFSRSIPLSLDYLFNLANSSEYKKAEPVGAAA